MVRRTVRLNDGVVKHIQIYRAKFLLKGKDKTFNDALNELLESLIEDEAEVDK